MKIFKNEKYAIGMFVDGSFLHIAWLSKIEKIIQVLELQTIPFTNSSEITHLETKQILNDALDSTPIHITPEINVEDQLIENSYENDSTVHSEIIDITSEIEESELDKPSTSETSQDNSSIFLDLFAKYGKKSNRIAISLSEPQIYYSYFENGCGLTGNKLKQKIINELNPSSQIIKHDAIHITKLAKNQVVIILV